MINNTLVWTALLSSFFVVVALKFLHYFNFIKWSPIGWAKKWSTFSSMHYSIKWTLLFISLVILFGILYIIVSYTTTIPPSVTSLLIGILVVFAIEWTIHSDKTLYTAIKSISVPFFAVMAIVLRFITGTAVFMKKLADENLK